MLNHNGSGQHYASNDNWQRQSSADYAAPSQEVAPPLPSSAPPPTRMVQWNTPHDPAYGNVALNLRQSGQQPVNSFTRRPTSLPPYVAPPPAISPGAHNISVVDGGRRASESGSESEQSSGGSRKDRDYKRSSVLSNLFGRRKKSSQS